MSGRFAGTHAVVTGASSGIGQSIAISLAQAGADEVLVHYRQNRSGAEQTVAAIRDVGGRASVIAADLSTASDIQRLVATAFDRLGTIETWVNNAGADVLTGSASDLDFDEKLHCLLNVDVRGTIAVARQVAQRMLDQSRQRPAAMVFIGWDQAAAGMEGDAGQMFGPVKAAVAAFAASLAQSVAPRIRVNTIAPGWIRTSWGESTTGYWDQRARGQALMQRWGEPRDVAEAVLYVADPANTFLTGHTIEINGGWSRRFGDPTLP